MEPILSKLGESVSKNSEDLAKLVKTKEEIFSEGIKEYQLYCNTVKSVLKNRDHMQVSNVFSFTLSKMLIDQASSVSDHVVHQYNAVQYHSEKIYHSKNFSITLTVLMAFHMTCVVGISQEKYH